MQPFMRQTDHDAVTVSANYELSEHPDSHFQCKYSEYTKRQNLQVSVEMCWSSQ